VLGAMLALPLLTRVRIQTTGQAGRKLTSSLNNLSFLYKSGSGVTLAVDATHNNASAIPRGMQAAGYDTGSSGIAWTAADYAAHPGAVHIDQDARAGVPSSDVLDVESGAATPSECAGWVRAAWADFKSVARKGQRMPAIYTSADQVSAVVNALISGGIQSGVFLWIANWNLTEPQAQAEVLAAAGPFPIIAVQYTDRAVVYDNDVFSSAWLADVSGASAPPTVKNLKAWAAYDNATAHWDPTPGATHYGVTVTTNRGNTQVSYQTVTDTRVVIHGLSQKTSYAIHVIDRPDSEAVEAVAYVTTE
jgi:hypothetical protein